MESVILFRFSTEVRDEYEVAQKYFNIVKYRNECPNHLLVIPRYSALPYYNELEKDLDAKYSVLIQSFAEHDYIASFSYYYDIFGFTPRTWFSMADLRSSNYKGPVVIKGVTNSKKYKWNTHMYAETWEDVLRITSELQNDGLLGYQKLIYREYIPLKTFDIGINGIRYTNEHRCFFLGKELISHGAYWSTAPNPEKAILHSRGLAVAQEVAGILAEFTNFYAVDVAETEDNEWIVIEVNCGTSSGLSENDPDTFYRNLKQKVDIYL
jgi:hypothetical protein